MDFINAEAAFECQTCHGTVFKLPDIPTDDSIAKCKTCGTEFGRWGDVKEKAAKAAVKAALGDAIKGTGFKLRLFDRPPARLVVEIDIGESPEDCGPERIKRRFQSASDRRRHR